MAIVARKTRDIAQVVDATAPGQTSQISQLVGQAFPDTE
jgi:hypothetical protein